MKEPKVTMDQVKDFPNRLNSLYYFSNLKVCKSGAGYYIGRMGLNYDVYSGSCWEEPFTRESGYFETTEGAEYALKNGFEVRRCMENDASYGDSTLPWPKTGY